MSDFLDEVINFDPQSVSVFNPVEEAPQRDVNIYKTNPVKYSKSEDGHYYSRVKVLYNPFSLKESVVVSAYYAMKDADGFFTVPAQPGRDYDCPLGKSFGKLWVTKDKEKQEWAKQMHDKSVSSWVLVQIIEDANQPDLVGQIKMMKIPKAINVKLNSKMNPSPESKKQPQALMDWLIGPVLEIDVAPGPDDPTAPDRKQREISYDACEFATDPTPIIKVDGTPFFTDEEVEIIEEYFKLKNEIYKAKSEATRNKKAEELKVVIPRIQELYKQAIDYMKENSLNLVDEVGYKEWTPEQTTRVTNWINLVQQMIDPATYTEPEILASAEASLSFTSGIGESQPEELTEDDLPF